MILFLIAYICVTLVPFWEFGIDFGVIDKKGDNLLISSWVNNFAKFGQRGLFS